MRRSNRALMVSVATVVSLALIGCNSANSDPSADTVLLTLLPAEEPVVYGMAPLQGRVDAVDQCIRLTTPEDVSYTLVFPDGYELAGDNKVVVADGEGNPKLIVASNVEIGGAPLSEESAEELLSDESLARCTGPYFMVSPN